MSHVSLSIEVRTLIPSEQSCRLNLVSKLESSPRPHITGSKQTATFCKGSFLWVGARSIVHSCSALHWQGRHPRNFKSCICLFVSLIQEFINADMYVYTNSMRIYIYTHIHIYICTSYIRIHTHLIYLCPCLGRYTYNCVCVHMHLYTYFYM